jgi:hypothetical protein
MLEGVTLENSRVYLADMIARLFALNSYIGLQPGFVKNTFTDCAQQCVTGLHDKTGHTLTLTEACTVQEALHFVAVHVESKLLQMQRDIDQTIYKDDAHVKQEVKKLLEKIDNGFVYFWDVSDQQYLEYVAYNLQKLYDKNKTIKTQVYWKQRISRDLSGVRELEQKRQLWITENQTTTVTQEMVLNAMLYKIQPSLVAARDWIDKDTQTMGEYKKKGKSFTKAEWNTEYNVKLLENIMEYIDRSITTPGVKPAKTYMPHQEHVTHFLRPKQRGALLDGGDGGRRDITELLEQLLELSL